MTLEDILRALHTYRDQLTEIERGFSQDNHGALHIGANDNDRFRTIVFELRDLFREHIPKTEVYVEQLLLDHKNGVSSFMGTSSLDSVRKIGGIVKAVTTKIHRSNTSSLSIDQQTIAAPNADTNDDARPAVFISHCNADAKVAKSLVKLIKTALHLKSDEIRCTSAEGYRLPAGAAVSNELRREIRSAKAFIALLSLESLESIYVLFELGARWGNEQQLCPLMIKRSSVALKAPLNELNVLDTTESDMLSLIETIASVLGLSVEKSSAIIGDVKSFCRKAAQRKSPLNIKDDPKPQRNSKKRQEIDLAESASPPASEVGTLRLSQVEFNVIWSIGLYREENAENPDIDAIIFMVGIPRLGVEEAAESCRKKGLILIRQFPGFTAKFELTPHGRTFALRQWKLGSNRLEAWQAYASEEWSPLLFSKQWRLVYGASSGSLPRTSKILEFKSDGKLGDGRNENEHSWRIASGKLELLQQDGKLHNRFTYDPASGTFKSTNDSARVSTVVDQFIASDHNLPAD